MAKSVLQRVRQPPGLLNSPHRTRTTNPTVPHGGCCMLHCLATVATIISVAPDRYCKHQDHDVCQPPVTTGLMQTSYSSEMIHTIASACRFTVRLIADVLRSNPYFLKATSSAVDCDAAGMLQSSQPSESAALCSALVATSAASL